MQSAKTRLKFDSMAIKESATIKVVIKSSIKQTVGAVLGDTVDLVVSNFIKMRDNHDAARPPNPLFLVPDIVQVKSG